MKKVIFTLFVSFTSLSLLIAQPCGVTSSCTPTGGPATGGFGDNNNYPCIVKGEYYEYIVQFKMFEVFNYLGTQNVDSVEFVSISNLPCGICWAVNRTDKRYAKNQDGCLQFSGTSNDATGQYKLGLSLKAWINGGGQPITVPAALTEQAGIKLYLRVIANAQSVCPTLDTTSAFQGNLTAATGCTVGVNDMVAQVTELSIVPNPMNTSAQVEFTAINSGIATASVYDLAGKLVQQSVLYVAPGLNSTVLERKQLPAGAYFYALSLNGTTTTKHFFIAD